MPAACDKKVLFDRRKKRCDFSSAGLTLMLQTTQYSQSQLIKIKNQNPHYIDGLSTYSLPIHIIE
jgi:hypothetical protein